MLLKTVKEVYDRYLADPSADQCLVRLTGQEQEERYRRVKMIRDLTYRAIPFVIEPSALDLIATIQSGVKLVEDLGPLLLETPLPFDSVWVEFEEEVEDKRCATGVLLQKISGKILICSVHRRAGEPLLEPLLFLTVGSDGVLDMRVDPFTATEFLKTYEGTQEEKVSKFFNDAFPQTGWGLLNAVSAFHLIAAKKGPLDAEEEPMFPRPERRRMEREGRIPTGAPVTVTRIRVNAQGRLHLQAVDDEEGGAGGARRRAHRVRGHYMRTAKGSSWRAAHVRGYGAVNETVRVVGATSSD